MNPGQTRSSRLSFNDGPYPTTTVINACEIIRSCPPYHVHPWLFRAALRLKALGLTTADRIVALQAATTSYHRPMRPNEIEDAVCNSDGARKVPPRNWQAV